MQIRLFLSNLPGYFNIHNKQFFTTSEVLGTTILQWCYDIFIAKPVHLIIHWGPSQYILLHLRCTPVWGVSDYFCKLKCNEYFATNNKAIVRLRSSTKRNIIGELIWTDFSPHIQGDSRLIVVLTFMENGKQDFFLKYGIKQILLFSICFTIWMSF